MDNEELRKSWTVTLRHLAASRFFLLEHLPSQEAEDCWAQVQSFLHHNELELGLEQLQELGELCFAPKEFWLELLLAAESMGLKAYSEYLRQRL